MKDRRHALWLMTRPEGPMAAGQTGRVFGLSDAWVRELVPRYNQRGPDALADGREVASGRPASTWAVKIAG